MEEELFFIHEFFLQDTCTKYMHIYVSQRGAQNVRLNVFQHWLAVSDPRSSGGQASLNILLIKCLIVFAKFSDSTKCFQYLLKAKTILVCLYKSMLLL